MTAAALVVLTIGFVLVLLTLARTRTTTASAPSSAIRCPAILMLLFALVATFHMQLGMRSIILDYLHGHAREWALIANVCFAGAVALACVYAVLRIGFV